MKKELSALSELVRHLSELFACKRMTTISVIIHNMAFIVSDESKEEEIKNYLIALKLFKEFRPDCHVSQWSYSEADMILMGYFMSQVKDTDLERDFFEDRE